MNKNKRYAYITILCSLAIVINLIENLFIPPIAFGIRFGLANIVSLVALKTLGTKEMGLVALLRLTLGNLIKGTIFGTPFWISSLGIIFSSVVILLLDKLKASISFTSMMSSIAHTFGQLIVVCIIYNQINVIAILPLLIVSSLATGAFTGIITNKVLKRIKINGDKK